MRVVYTNGETEEVEVVEIIRESKVMLWHADKSGHDCDLLEIRAIIK